MAVALSAKHADVVAVGHKVGALRVDLASADSITQMFRSVGVFDAVVSTAGVAKFGSLDDLKDADFQVGSAIN
ncbi:MAG: hypothetical protein U0361_04580 [Nitrospiraceae bacterium]